MTPPDQGGLRMSSGRQSVGIFTALKSPSCPIPYGYGRWVECNLFANLLSWLPLADSVGWLFQRDAFIPLKTPTPVKTRAFTTTNAWIPSSLARVSLPEKPHQPRNKTKQKGKTASKKNKTFSRQVSLDSVTFPLPCVEHKTFGERKGFVCTTTTATPTRQSLASGDFVDPSKSTEQRVVVVVVVVVWQKVFVFGVGDWGILFAQSGAKGHTSVTRAKFNRLGRVKKRMFLESGFWPSEEGWVYWLDWLKFVLFFQSQTLRWFGELLYYGLQNLSTQQRC